MSAARLRRLSGHVLVALPSSDMEPVRAGGENGIPFERWKVGQRFYTTCRTISDSDISTFVQLTGFQVRAYTCSVHHRSQTVSVHPTVTKHLASCPWQAENLFADMEYLKSQGHPARMAPGLLTASVADALIVGSGIIEGYAVAMIGIDNLMAKKGVYAGDTVTANFQVSSRVVSAWGDARLSWIHPCVDC